MRRATLRELAAARGVTLPERLVDDFPDEWQVLGWPRFQRLYDLARGVLRTPEDIHRIVRERAEDEAADGSRWLELQVTPTGYATRFGDVVTGAKPIVDPASYDPRRFDASSWGKVADF